MGKGPRAASELGAQRAGEVSADERTEEALRLALVQVAAVVRAAPAERKSAQAGCRAEAAVLADAYSPHVFSSIALMDISPALVLAAAEPAPRQAAVLVAARGRCQ